MNLRLWPEKIWPVCPELQPPLLCPINPPPSDGSGFKFFLFTRGMNESFVEAVVDDVASALIFAKAVLWLADNNGSVGLERLYGGGYGVLFVTTKPVAEASTPIEAAYLAVCHVLKVTP